MTRIGLIPGCLALLPAYTSLEDPVPDLRAACVDLASWLGDDVAILGSTDGRRVAEALLAGRRSAAGGAEASYLVVANGSACRGDAAPGHLDQRSFAFDDALRTALAQADPRPLRCVDHALATSLQADVGALPALADLLAGRAWSAHLDYDGDPYGVQYWVARWSDGSASPASVEP